ncbi:MAG: competence/damage-inducible protein A [Saprospiraceae bacterium]|nr:competence/damage-inducible protein A [Saprospiraceae bacterium]
MKATLLTVGDELLIGQVIDSNAAWIAGQLYLLGIGVARKISVGDNLPDIIEAVEMSFHDTDVILMTGGLGPTKDDVTKKALMQYFNCELVFSEETYERIRKIFEKRNIPLREAHRNQCFLPDKAELLFNRLGTAPGMWFESNGKILVSMPGVPYEMKYIMEHGVLPRLKDRSGTILLQKTIRTIGVGESSLADLVEPLLIESPVKIAYLPSIGQVRLRLSIEGQSADGLQELLEEKVSLLERELGSIIFGYDETTIEDAIGQMLRQRKLSLITAESCTGGYLAHLITSVPGSSDYFTGSIVAYSNSIKTSILHVSPKTLERWGAVSKQTVEEMVRGALRSSEADLAVAVSGIAGPGGGSDDKPVGTIWIAVGDIDNIITKEFLFTKDRIINIKYTGIYALDLLRKFLLAR